MNSAARSSKEGEQYNECDKKEMLEITVDEIQSAINKLNKGKACDNNGIRAEHIKDCDDMTKEMMRQIFNEVIKRVALQKHGEEYESKLSTKKGSEEDARNCRPICTLPALYKLFSTILHNRLCSRLDSLQPEDQGGFRRSHQTLDHLITYRLIEKKSREWCVKMWLATIDIVKAFNSITYDSIWKALETCGMEQHCINLVRRLYFNRKATVMTDEESELFEVKRETKQGDLLSSLLINTEALKDDLKEKSLGICLSDCETRCALVCDVPRTATENVMSFQAKH